MSETYSAPTILGIALARRRRMSAGVGALALIAAAALPSAGPAAAAQPGCSRSGDTTTCRFDFTGGEQTFTVPDGVTSLTVRAIGAHGGCIAWQMAPESARAPLAVNPGDTLFVEVGGGGGAADQATNTPGAGGFNGGGTGGTGYLSGCGGGGASDIRTVGADDPDSLRSRLLIGAGGGGGGGGGNGGSTGGAAGTATAGGKGGPGRADGADGTFGVGGDGGSDDGTVEYACAGGGGGGGYYGGGGSGAFTHTGPGGKGSSFGPPGTVVDTAGDQESAAVIIDYVVNGSGKR
ncbi:glycine-rich protein [Nocardia arthritidis]|uniref:receptor protein-tyrosine kinase n=1 Tax=Nocardia arthritidis TaxID=228602 RepID=A0A6G9YAJ6_9NOCA|nr:glycine-rich protein [Nocardia arthritidis]QIS10086.1 hypothetical protein F5544_10955 [Nocardia arthritidis]